MTENQTGEPRTYCPVCEGYTTNADNWSESNGALCCSAYCRAINAGASEQEAQQARAEHTERVADSLREARINEARAILEAEGVSVGEKS